MAYKKLSGPDFPEWPTMYYDAGKNRAKICDSVLDWKGRLTCRFLSAIVVTLIIAASVLLIGGAIVTQQGPGTVWLMIGAAVIAFCAYGFVIGPLIESICKKKINVVFDKKAIRIGRKKHPRQHRGASLSHSFSTADDLDAQKRASTDKKLHDTMRFEISKAQIVLMTVRSSVLTATMEGSAQTPGVQHRVTSGLTDDQAVQLSSACDYLLKQVDSENVPRAT